MSREANERFIAMGVRRGQAESHDQIKTLTATVDTMTVRMAARNRRGLDPADAQALEGALQMAEEEVAAEQATVEKQAGEIERLRGALALACDEWADSLQYVEKYFRTKWGYETALAKARKALAEGES